MDTPEPQETPFAAVTAHTSHAQQLFQSYLDKSTPFKQQRWASTIGLFCLFCIRILWVQGWYIVAYTLCIYLLNIFLAFISPKFDPSLESDEGMEDGAAGGLPSREDEEFRPFVRRLPEFKFWYSATQAIVFALIASVIPAFDLPVFWPVLVMYFIILFVLTMRRQIQHMIKYRYVPFNFGKTKYGNGSTAQL